MQEGLRRGIFCVAPWQYWSIWTSEGAIERKFYVNLLKNFTFFAL